MARITRLIFHRPGLFIFCIGPARLFFVSAQPVCFLYRSDPFESLYSVCQHGSDLGPSPGACRCLMISPMNWHLDFFSNVFYSYPHRHILHGLYPQYWKICKQSILMIKCDFARKSSTILRFARFCFLVSKWIFV